MLAPRLCTHCDGNLWTSNGGEIIILRAGPCGSLKASNMSKKQQSLSYEELSRGGRELIDRLAEGAPLDDATRARCAHLGRFFARLGQAIGQVADRVAGRTLLGSVLSEDDLLKIWRETADEGASPRTVEPRRSVH
jgi:hypothetical protein